MNAKQVKTTIGIAVILTIAVVVWLLWRDEPPPDVSDLWLERLDIADEENAFTYLDFPEGTLYRPKDSKKRDRYNELKDWKIWDEKLARESLEHNRKAFELLDKAMKCKYFQVPEMKSQNTNLSYLQRWRGLARSLSINARYLFKNGKEKEAFDEAIKIIRFGHRIEDCRGGVITYFVGNAIRNIGMIAVRRMLIETMLEPADLREYTVQLAEYEANMEGMVNTLKIEYMSTWGTIDAMITGRLDEEYRHNNWGKKAPRAGYMFKPNATRRLMAEAHRALIDNARSDFAGQKNIESLPFFKTCEASSALSRNKAGQIMTLTILPAYSLIIDKKFKSQVESRATEILIALRCHQLKHGELPDTLNELVPEYLEEVPKDPYDGKPLRYSKQKRIIWSVGPDLVDLGGPTDADWEIKENVTGDILRNASDPAVRITF